MAFIFISVKKTMSCSWNPHLPHLPYSPSPSPPVFQKHKFGWFLPHHKYVSNPSSLSLIPVSAACHHLHLDYSSSSPTALWSSSRRKLSKHKDYCDLSPAPIFGWLPVTFRIKTNTFKIAFHGPAWTGVNTCRFISIALPLLWASATEALVLGPAAPSAPFASGPLSSSAFPSSSLYLLLVNTHWHSKSYLRHCFLHEPSLIS